MDSWANVFPFAKLHPEQVAIEIDTGRRELHLTPLGSSVSDNKASSSMTMAPQGSRCGIRLANIAVSSNTLYEFVARGEWHVPDVLNPLADHPSARFSSTPSLDLVLCDASGGQQWTCEWHQVASDRVLDMYVRFLVPPDERVRHVDLCLTWKIPPNPPNSHIGAVRPSTLVLDLESVRWRVAMANVVCLRKRSRLLPGTAWPDRSCVHGWFDRVWVINLEHEPHKWLACQYALRQFGVYAERVAAVNAVDVGTVGHRSWQQACASSAESARAFAQPQAWGFRCTLLELLRTCRDQHVASCLVLQDSIDWIHKQFETLVDERIRRAAAAALSAPSVSSSSSSSSSVSSQSHWKLVSLAHRRAPAAALALSGSVLDEFITKLSYKTQPADAVCESLCHDYADACHAASADEPIVMRAADAQGMDAHALAPWWCVRDMGWAEAAPRIGVLLPVHKTKAMPRPAVVAKWIEILVCNMRAQTYPNWRLLVLDTTGSASTLSGVCSSDPRVHYRQCANHLNQEAHVSLGVTWCHQEAMDYVTWTSLSELSSCDRLARPLGALLYRPELAVATAQCKFTENAPAALLSWPTVWSSALSDGAHLTERATSYAAERTLKWATRVQTASQSLTRTAALRAALDKDNACLLAKCMRQLFGLTGATTTTAAAKSECAAFCVVLPETTVWACVE